MVDKRDVYRFSVFFFFFLQTNLIRIGCCFFHFSYRLCVSHRYIIARALMCHRVSVLGTYPYSGARLPSIYYYHRRNDIRLSPRDYTSLLFRGTFYRCAFCTKRKISRLYRQRHGGVLILARDILLTSKKRRETYCDTGGRDVTSIRCYDISELKARIHVLCSSRRRV